MSRVHLAGFDESSQLEGLGRDREEFRRLALGDVISSDEGCWASVPPRGELAMRYRRRFVRPVRPSTEKTSQLPWKPGQPRVEGMDQAAAVRRRHQSSDGQEHPRILAVDSLKVFFCFFFLVEIIETNVQTYRL